MSVSIATHRYEHTRALFDGTVPVEGVDVRMDSRPLVSDIFEPMVRDQAWDVAELGLTFYLRTLELDEPPFVAIPVFPARHFRHSAIFVNTEAGIERPEDLAGRTVGEFGIYGHDAGIWPKGILADDHGVRPEQCRWRIGATDWTMPPFDFVPAPHPDGVEVLPADKPLGDMLASGEIDALISARAPKVLLDGVPTVARLFDDAEAVEREWCARTGMFPIMHTVVVRREVLARRPELARALFTAFDAAKDLALAEYRDDLIEQNIGASLPWVTPLVDRTRALLGDDWWPYGVGANRTTLDTFLRYFHEQGLSSRRLTVEDVFAPELLDT